MSEKIVFSKEEIVLLLESAKKGLSGESFDELAEKLDLADKVLCDFRDKIELALGTDEEIEFVLDVDTVAPVETEQTGIYVDDGKPEGNELFPRQDWQYDVNNGDTKLGYAEWVNHNIESARHCSECGADLYATNAVTREYVNKGEGESAFGSGHYDPLTGYYEPDGPCDLSNGNYDLVDGSDSCSACKTVF